MNKALRTGLLCAVTALASASTTVVTVADPLPAGVDAVKVAPPSKDHPLPEILSGWNFRTDETKMLQMDDFDNPAFIWVERGEEIWNTVEGSAGKSCASCHNDAAESMKGVGASYPKWNAKLEKPLNLEMRIDLCRTENMGADAYKFDAEDQKSLVTYVRHQSRGMPVKVQQDGPMQPWHDKGKEIYYTRYGQLNLACASCHEQNYGNHIRADHLSQGQSNGFPTYRLKQGAMVSLHNRFKGCVRDVRATPFTPMSDELLALEVYLAYRGEGLPVETPAVRQ